MYEPLFMEGSNIANDSRMGTVKSNPLYVENNNTGVNPLFEHKSNLRTAADEDCDGVEGLDVFLLDPNSRTAVAKTTTGSCGDFWFANVPEGAYIVKIAGALKGKKGYDVSFSKDGKYDIAGEIRTPDDPWAVFINTDNSHSNEKTAINNSHSNIKNLILLEADLDGDGEFESLKAQGSFSDGSTRDITSDIRTSSANKNIMFGAEALSMRRRVEVLKSNKLASSRHLTSITVTAGDLDGDGIGDTRAIATFSDGSTEDVTDALTINTSHSNIKQFSITVADLDGDGEADAILKTKTKSNQSNDRVATGDLNGDGATEGIIKTKTKSNQSNDRVAVGDINGDGVTEAIIKTKTKSNQSNDRVAVGDVNGDGVNEAINTSHSNLKTLRVSAGDADGDGIPDVVVGSGFSNSSKTFFETGDKPTQEQRMPGDPIPGIDVKLGRNGTDIKTTSTNSYGEFEFKNLDAGNYHVTISNDYYVSDETLVVVDRADENKTVVRGWDPVKKESITGRVDNNNNVQKAQNNNTVRSNRSEFGMSMIEADLDGDGEFESSYLSANGEVASITIDEAGTAKLIDKRAGGIKQTMQTQVLMSGDTKSNVGPVKWTAPESGNKRVWGDPHVDEKDGSLKLGEGNFGTVYKGKWRSSDVAIKPVRCSDGSCRIITDKAEDYPDASGLSLNGLPPGTPIDNAAVWFTDDRGKIYKSMTDGNGRVSLNGLPPGIPLKMIVNIGVDGSEDIIMKVSGSGGGSAGSIYLMKARHDVAMNAIRNMKG
ncbi:MAG: hypothetical protein E6H06_09280 [Bacteroidetes bacterium]|nr:MAG: hypothetical protein E6H06_09280 [Bacteroidota bacterium]